MISFNEFRSFIFLICFKLKSDYFFDFNGLKFVLALKLS